MMGRKKYIISLLLAACCANVFAQKKKADAYYNDYQYVKAIPLYKKAAKNDEEALEKLADCYRITKNYQQAEIYYGKLAAKKTNDANAYYRYAEALMNNNKYDEAKKEFDTYAKLKPEDKKAKLYAKSCEDIKIWSAQPPIYKVYNLGDVNTEVSDFAPTVYKDGIVFSSEKPRDLITGQSSGWTGNPYLSLVYAKAHKSGDSVTYGKAKPLSAKFSNDFHNGPATFSSDQSTIYFTRVDNVLSKNKEFVNRPKIIMAHQKGGTWKSFEPFPFNSNEYAVGHPSLSKDGQTLYFASNMPGGFGGTDIYVCRKQGDSWGKPENLGPEINTSSDESYPCITEKGTLYFASNGHANFGGLDIFYSNPQSGKWTTPANMMPPVNSTTDDFGVVFKDEKTGFFSSNRAGGKGSDDIYGFRVVGSLTSIAGKILFSMNEKDALPNVKVFLLTEQGVVLQQSTTDMSGFFRFENISSEAKYMVKLDEGDPAIASKPKIYLSDTKSKVVRVIVKNGKGLFMFENLPSDLTTLAKLEEDDPSMHVSYAGTLLGGDERVPLVNTMVKLTNDRGDVVQTATTNAFGAFVFTNLPPDKNYLITLTENDPTIKTDKVYFVNKSGKEIALLNRAGGFKYNLLASDKTALSLLAVKDVDLRIDLKGKIVSDDESKSPVKNSKVNVLNEKGEIVQSGVTDAFGGFSFTNLPADKNYLVSLDEEDVMSAKKNFIIIDDKGNLIGKLRLNNGKFKFEILPSEQKSLATIYVDDPWLHINKLKTTKKDSLIIIENIYYDYGKWDILPEAKVTLDKVVKVMKDNPDISIDLSSHTDSRSSNDFNMTLSQKRADATVKYITSKGVDVRRITGKGFGESKLINRCKDGTDCTEEEHAQNRRTEFKVTKNNK